MTGEPTHTASEMVQRVPTPYRLKSELSIMSTMFNPLQGRDPEILSGPARHGLQ